MYQPRPADARTLEDLVRMVQEEFRAIAGAINEPNFSQVTFEVLNNEPSKPRDGNVYYADIITSNTFALYTDASLLTPLDATGYTIFPYTGVTDTTSGVNEITVGNSAPFANNYSVKFSITF